MLLKKIAGFLMHSSKYSANFWYIFVVRCLMTCLIWEKTLSKLGKKDLIPLFYHNKTWIYQTSCVNECMRSKWALHRHGAAPVVDVAVHLGLSERACVCTMASKGKKSTFWWDANETGAVWHINWQTKWNQKESCRARGRGGALWNCFYFPSTLLGFCFTRQ